MDIAGVQLVDLGIFFSMGALWLLGATFIVLVWRWVIRYERENPDHLNRPPVPGPVVPVAVAGEERLGEAACAASLPVGPRGGLVSGMLG